MLYASLFLFIAVATLGIFLTALLARKKRVPLPIGLIHGLVGLATLGLLVVGVFLVPHPMIVNDAVFMFFVAAVIGIFIFLLGRDGATPVPLAIAHGISAIAAIGILIAGLAHGLPH